MGCRVFSHVYRNRHGTFYFRLIFPVEVRELTQRRERRFSLETEVRSVAVAKALRVIEAKNSLIIKLREIMANEGVDDVSREKASKLYALWLAQVRENIRLKGQIDELKDERNTLVRQLRGTVSKEKAKDVAVRAHALGKTNSSVHVSKSEFDNLLDGLRFPWAANKTVLYSELMSAYLDSLIHRGKNSPRRPLSAASLSDYKPALETFLEVMGDRRIGSIDRALAGEFNAILETLPANIKKLKKFRDKSIAEIIEMGEPPQATSNVAKKMERISSMFNWALQERNKWGIDTNPFSGFGQSRSAKMKSSRRPFKMDELKLLLSHPTYITGKFSQSYQFWLIPMALYTGARLGELCQLALDDLKEIDGVWCIDLTDEQGIKRLKNHNAKRLIPIHRELIRMGLLRHVQRLRKAGSSLLFDDGELSGRHQRGKGHAASKWFKAFRDKAGVTGKQEAVFHSFRHTFITTLLDSGINAHLIAPIVGHEGELITDTVYWGKRDAVKRQTTVEAFSLPDDVVSLLPNVEDVTIHSLSQVGKKRSA